MTAHPSSRGFGRSRAFTPEEEQQLVAEYQGGSTADVLAAKHGVTRCTIYAALRRAGSPAIYTSEQRRAHMLNVIAQQRGLSDDIEATIAADYLSGKSSGWIGRKHGISPSLVFMALKRQGVRRRYHTRPLALNEAAFDDAENNPNAAYWVGMLMADGCVSERDYGLSVKLSLTETDGEHIADFRSFLGSGHKIGTELRKPSPWGGVGMKSLAIVSFCSKKIPISGVG